MSIINTTDLNYFLHVAQAKNISRAADLVGITQPSLSTALKRLESQLDVCLVIRDRHGVHLTKAGEKLAQLGKKVITDCIQLQKELKKQEDQVCGRFTVGCHPSVALYSLPVFLPQLILEHSELEISLQHGLSREVTNSVIRGEIDFGIVINPVEHDDLVMSSLGEDRVEFWRGPKKTILNDLDSQRVTLIYDPDLFQSQTLVAQARKKKVVFNSQLTSSSLEVISSLVSTGMGVGILPTRVAHHFKSYKLKSLKNSLPSYRDKIYLIYRQDQQKSMAAKTIIAKIKEGFKEP